MSGNLKAPQTRQCGRSIRWKARNLILTCERITRHQGCHLDVTHGIWFDRRKDKKWLIAPRGEKGYHVVVH